MTKQTLAEKAGKIRLVIFDVDGVLTDGGIYMGESGELFKPFHVHDGLGIRLLQKTGVTVAVITSRESSIVTQRMNYLGVKYIYQGHSDKVPAFENLIAKLNMPPEQVAYLGDDLPDIPVMRRVGLSIAVANATRYVKHCADWQTQASGGHGAVREVCEFIMDAQNTLKPVIKRYLEDK